MSGSASGNNRPHDVEHETMAIVIALALIAALCAYIWYFHREIISVPLGWFLLAQFKLIALFDHSPVVSDWLTYLSFMLGHIAIAKSVTGTTMIAALAYVMNRLFVCYFVIALAMYVQFERGNSDEDFTGQFHPTGFEYREEWCFLRGPAPHWLQSMLNARDDGQDAIQFFGFPLLRYTRTKQPIPQKTIFIFGKAVLRKKEVRARVGRSFIAYQARVWRHLKPLTVWDPFDCIQNLDDILRPEEWAFRRGIISREARDEILGRTQNWRQDRALHHNVNQARRTFESQVRDGGRWAGVRQLPPYCQALVMVLHLNRANKQKAAVQLSYECFAAVTPLYKLRSDAPRDAIKQARDAVNVDIQRILNGQHKNAELSQNAMLTNEVVNQAEGLLSGFWWRRTALVALYGYSGPNMRWGGSAPILQPALIQWVQSMDRELYLALNGVGGETFHAEAMGIIAQYQIEFAFKNACRSRIKQLQRSLTILQESVSTHAKENNIPFEQAAGPTNLAAIKQLQADISLETAKATREPALNVNGPLNWLEALITSDRNEAGEDIAFP